MGTIGLVPSDENNLWLTGAILVHKESVNRVRYRIGESSNEG